MAGILNIIIAPPSPIFNSEEIPVFDNFSKENSIFLYSTLYLNHVDVLSGMNGNFDVTSCFDEKDKEYLPTELNNENIKKEFINTTKIWESLSKVIAKKITKENPSLLIIFSPSIGISHSCINKSFNLLNYDDNNILLGKTITNKISFFGFNFFSERLINGLNSLKISYDDMLSYTNKFDNFLFTINGYSTIENIADFRELYKVLSKKESIKFCSQEMHERFTHLFIEYKELL